MTFNSLFGIPERVVNENELEVFFQLPFRDSKACPIPSSSALLTFNSLFGIPGVGAGAVAGGEYAFNSLFGIQVRTAPSLRRSRTPFNSLFGIPHPGSLMETTI